MSGDHRRLVALAAALAPGRVEALLSRLHVPGAGQARAAAAALAQAPRRTRLAALSTALACAAPPVTRASTAAPRPLVARLLADARRRAEAAAARTMVRPADPRGAALAQRSAGLGVARPVD